MPGSSKPNIQPQSQTLIPETYLDIPSQRLYILSLGLLCQAIKILDFILSIASPEERSNLCRKWLIVDLFYCIILSQLRIPRLHYNKTTVLLQICILWFLDGVMFGGIIVHSSILSGGASEGAEVAATPESFSVWDIIGPLTFGVISRASSKDSSHLLGQHTVRMSPISTAQLNPTGATFCLSSKKAPVLLPVLLNNTNVAGLRYSITPLTQRDDTPHQKVEYFDLSGKELKAIEQGYRESLQQTRSTTTLLHDEEYDEYDEEDAEHKASSSPLQTTQSLVYIRLTKPGVVSLERVTDTNSVEAKLLSSIVVVAPCPQVSFTDDATSDVDSVRCAGQQTDSQLMLDVYGVPPLSLRWMKTVNGYRETFLVEGIEGDHIANRALPQELKIPLTITFDKPGTYLYALEEISDGIGNVVRVGSTSNGITDPTSKNKTKNTRSFLVLQKPTVSFEHCSSDNPTSLLIGSEASLVIKTFQADEFDAPWEVYLKYQPPTGSKDKILKPWRKTLKTQNTRRELSIRASAPGDYTIGGVKGKWCSGKVLVPETCRVVERPLPSAEIEWKRIHECSGDTGVSASLVLRGTPPFHVYYRVQRDNEPARELSKTFASSRGELTLQPDRSGHYTFTFTHLIIHPLASADFVETSAGMGKARRKINSCAKDVVDVDVELKGTGPWNLELQIIGPENAETLLVEGIEMHKKRLQVPIPEPLKRNGGNFEINLVSVEDMYKCKRPICVKSVRPTAMFYGTPEERHITVNEHERASLPLRLTGDGPWHLKYVRVGAEDKPITVVLTNPNDYLIVNEKGIYEIISIADSQCTGSVHPSSYRYEVGWVPRPSARLSSDITATYEPFNNSYILNPVCEGTADHVDLDLTGRPPFQIQYNIAEGNDAGIIKLIDQPNFSSIQPRARLQLQTLTPGRVYYEVKQIGDAAYPLDKYQNTRPSARFKNRNRITYCLNDAFLPLDTSSGDGILLLEGTPPFRVKVSVKDLASSHVDTQVIEVSDYVWKVESPAYTFKSIGPHRVTVESLTDASNCAQSVLDPLYSSIWIDVAETAAIIPFDRREDICVGEMSQFQLEGIPPWTIGYRINNKLYSQEAKVSPFQLLQQQSGEFTVASIAHQQKMCKAVVTDLKYTVHPLPSAQVGHGKRIYQDIHEGDQAEIVFTLIGEPPFTFTYQRSELSSKKGGKPGKVLETHTVSRVLAHEYSIFSALEGTWTVTSISDRFCRYPPIQPDVSIEKQHSRSTHVAFSCAFDH
ncbi:hypothetical protein BDQ17DRAFT_1386352 [Cyathus striatus]|nr:hypothetical protein BDQ17DRAFT_1386352 [Cyathus striatus]